MSYRARDYPQATAEERQVEIADRLQRMEALLIDAMEWAGTDAEKLDLVLRVFAALNAISLAAS